MAVGGGGAVAVAVVGLTKNFFNANWHKNIVC